MGIDKDEMTKALLNGLGVESDMVEGSTGYSILSAITRMREDDAPDPCPKCGSKMIVRRNAMMSWKSGHIQCTVCDYRNTVAAYLISEMVSVVPLPEDPEIAVSTPKSKPSPFEESWSKGSEEDE